MKTRKTLVTGICITVLTAGTGCGSSTNDGKYELDRDLAKSLIEAELLPITSIRLTTSAARRATNRCLDELALKKNGSYQETEAGAKRGLKVRYGLTRISIDEGATVGISVNGIKPVLQPGIGEPAGGGSVEQFKIALFDFESNDAELAETLNCFQGQEASFTLYDDGWRLEKLTARSREKK